MGCSCRRGADLWTSSYRDYFTGLIICCKKYFTVSVIHCTKIFAKFILVVLNKYENILTAKIFGFTVDVFFCIIFAWWSHMTMHAGHNDHLYLASYSVASKVFVIIQIRSFCKVIEPWYDWQCWSQPSNACGCVPPLHPWTARYVHWGSWWATNLLYFMLQYFMQPMCFSLYSISVLGNNMFGMR